MGLFGFGQLGGQGEALPGVPFVVIDLETTGLDPFEDRIVEIAMAQVENGRMVDEWATLLDPGRDPGPTFLHRISPAMVTGAPSFRDMVGEILARLDGTVVVAHHAAFEESFLHAELSRLGVDAGSMPALCTLQLARQVLACPNYKLATCCEICGIALTDAHTALGDVRATSILLPRLVSLAPDIRYPVRPAALPRFSRLAGPRTRAANLRKGEEGWMRSLLSKLPLSMSDHDPLGAQPYLDGLAEALADGRLTGDEARRLGRIAGRAGMGSAQVSELHKRFLDGLRDAALVDDYVSRAELKALMTAAELLDIPGYFEDITAEEHAEPIGGPRVWCGPDVPIEARQRLLASGYRLVANVSRGLVAAVTGTPHIKAEKAAQLGVPVIPVSQLEMLVAQRLPAPMAPAGWYPDPTGRFVYRYWTGQGWTEHASPGDGSTITDQL